MIYIHVPFCSSFCTYCDFYSVKCKEKGDVDSYTDALIKEIADRPPLCGGPSTLYIGGGTPSLMGEDFFRRVVEALEQYAPFEEFTVEANPDDVCKKGVEFFKTLKCLGVNRISMGVQSFDDAVLRWMGRRHNASDAQKAFSILREAGFDNISLDLISNINTSRIPGADENSVAHSLEKIISLRPEHISVYSLTVEPGTKLSGFIEKGCYGEPSQEYCEQQTILINRLLAGAGYLHYEISNYALPLRRAVHNSAYWNHSPYTGYGPAAHSFDGKERQWNPESVKKYISGVGRGREVLSQEQLRIEKIMLALRTSDGIQRSLLPKIKTNASICKGYLELVPGTACVRIPEDKWIISDFIISSLV